MPSNRVIGVDLGGTKILAGIVDANGTVERHRETPTPLDSQDELLAGLEAAVGELLDGDVAAVGFGIPSPIDQETGRVERSVNIPLGDLDFLAVNVVAQGRERRRTGLGRVGVVGRQVLHPQRQRIHT